MTKSGFRTKSEAQRALRQAITAHETGRSVTRSQQTVAAFVDQWHAAVKPALRDTTWVNYRNYLDYYVIPIIGETRLQDLTALRLNLLYAHLLEKGRVRAPGGLAPKTVQNVHRMLHRALRDAVKWNLLPRNVAEDAEPPRVRRSKPSIWTPAELGRFVAHVSEDRFRALWLLVATTGLRRGELAGLQRPDIDLDLGSVTPSRPRVVAGGRAIESDTKTRAGERSLALDPTTWDALRDYISTWEEERGLLGQDTQLLFVWPNGQALHPDTITALFHRHCDQAQLPRIRLHDVRHSYATAALKAGVAPKIISERLGHSTVAFTLQTYTHVIPGMDKDAAKLVADLIMDSGREANGSISGSIEALTQSGESEGPADTADNRRSAGPSSSSGGGVLVQDIPEACLKTSRSDVASHPGLSLGPVPASGHDTQPIADHLRGGREPTRPRCRRPVRRL